MYIYIYIYTYILCIYICTYIYTYVYACAWRYYISMVCIHTYKYTISNADTFLISKWIYIISLFTLREKCPYSELSWSTFSRIRTEYGEILTIRVNLFWKISSKKVIPSFNFLIPMSTNNDIEKLKLCFTLLWQ